MEIWFLRIRLQLAGKVRDLVRFNLAIDALESRSRRRSRQPPANKRHPVAPSRPFTYARLGRGVPRRPDRRGDLPQPRYFFAFPFCSFSRSTCHLMAKYMHVPNTSSLNARRRMGIESMIGSIVAGHIARGGLANNVLVLASNNREKRRALGAQTARGRCGSGFDCERLLLASHLLKIVDSRRPQP